MRIADFVLSKHSNFLSSTKPAAESTAWAGHIPFAFFIVSLLKPKILVELGVHAGGSYNAFCQAVRELKLDTKCYGVDTWRGDKHTGTYEEELYDQVVQYHRENYSFSTLLKKTFNEALENFSDQSIDLLHIDGCHTYEAVKKDFNTWLPKMKNDGVVIFHDICERSDDFGVWRFWEELKAKYNTIEMAHSHGLGVAFLGYKNAEVEQFASQFNQESFTKLLFEKMGNLFKENTELTAHNKGLQEAVNQYYQELEQRNHELIAQAQELNQKEQELIKTREALAVRDRELEHMSRQVNEMINSVSWKVTVPLRAVGQWVRKVRKSSPQIRLYLSKIVSKMRQVGLISALKKITRYPETDALKEFELWLEKNKLGKEDYEKIHKNLEELPYQPLISIILPVYNVEEKWLRVCIDSVQSQLYTNWELCIADDASTKTHVKRVLEEYRKNDERIKIIYRQENGHISAASNSALDLATGEYVALLDHDDEITVDALYENILLLNKHPEADLIYSDEARIDEDGRKHCPYFKPEWSPDTFLCQMYICHLGVYRTSLIKEIGGFREGFEGSQDYDLALRFTEKTNKIYHIPKVFYYWRTISQSVAGNPKAKEYAFTASYKAISEALSRRGEGGTVNQIPNCPGSYVVSYALKSRPLISIIISAGDELPATKKCIKTLLKVTDYDNYELIIIENNSSLSEDRDTYIELNSLTEKKISVIRKNESDNYSTMVNKAVSAAEGELVVLLSDKIEILTPDWLTKMAGQALRDSIGAVGAKIVFPDDTIQHAGIILGIYGAIGYSHRHVNKNEYGYFGRLLINSNYAAVSGACLMIKKDLYKDVGGLDEEYKTACSDIDMCLKLISNNHYNIVLPDVQMYIHEDIIKEYTDVFERFSIKDLTLLEMRWGDMFSNDPFYSPNLTREREDFSINLS